MVGPDEDRDWDFPDWYTQLNNNQGLDDDDAVDFFCRVIEQASENNVERYACNHCDWKEPENPSVIFDDVCDHIITEHRALVEMKLLAAI